MKQIISNILGEEKKKERSSSFLIISKPNFGTFVLFDPDEILTLPKPINDPWQIRNSSNSYSFIDIIILLKGLNYF